MRQFFEQKNLTIFRTKKKLNNFLEIKKSDKFGQTLQQLDNLDIWDPWIVSLHRVCTMQKCESHGLVSQANQKK